MCWVFTYPVRYMTHLNECPAPTCVAKRHSQSRATSEDQLRRIFILMMA